MIRHIFFIMISITSECLAEAQNTHRFHRDTSISQLTEAAPFLPRSRPETLAHEMVENRSFKLPPPVQRENSPPAQGLHVSTQSTAGNIRTTRSKMLTKITPNACDGSELGEQESAAADCALHSFKSLSPIERNLSEKLSLLYLERNMTGASSEAMKAAVVSLFLSGNSKKAHQLSKENDDLTGTFWHILSEVGSMKDLYIYTLKESPETIQALPIRTKKKMIDRLIRSSAPNIAKKWLAGNLTASLQSRYVKYLISEKNLANPQSMDATTGYLFSMANQRAGNIEESLVWLNERDFPPELRHSEKLLGNPQPNDPTVWGEVSKMIKKPDDISEMPPLKASRSLIEHSQATRKSLTSLISETNHGVKFQGSQFEFSD